MSWRLDSAWSVSPAMNSSATCRLNATLWERCLAMASILQKPGKGGQIYQLKLSTRRGALQKGVGIGSDFEHGTSMLRTETARSYDALFIEMTLRHPWMKLAPIAPELTANALEEQ